MDDKLAAVSKSVEDVEISDTFKSDTLKSPAGDKADEILAKLFTQVEVYLQAKLPEGFYKQFLMMQLAGLFSFIRLAVGKQLS